MMMADSFVGGELFAGGAPPAFGRHNERLVRRNQRGFLPIQALAFRAIVCGRLLFGEPLAQI